MIAFAALLAGRTPNNIRKTEKYQPVLARLSLMEVGVLPAPMALFAPISLQSLVGSQGAFSPSPMHLAGKYNAAAIAWGALRMSSNMKLIDTL